ncbi:MAG: hypothetical protein V3U75_06375, partial [Methylococcaceae bacterium]
EDGKIKKIIRQVYNTNNTKGINIVMDELEAVIKPVIQEMSTRAKDLEDDLENCRDELHAANNEVSGLESEIKNMEYAKEVDKMLEQFYSY